MTKLVATSSGRTGTASTSPAVARTSCAIARTSGVDVAVRAAERGGCVKAGVGDQDVALTVAALAIIEARAGRGRVRSSSSPAPGTGRTWITAATAAREARASRATTTSPAGAGCTSGYSLRRRPKVSSVARLARYGHHFEGVRATNHLPLPPDRDCIEIDPAPGTVLARPRLQVCRRVAAQFHLPRRARRRAGRRRLLDRVPEEGHVRVVHPLEPGRVAHNHHPTTVVLFMRITLIITTASVSESEHLPSGNERS